MSSALLWVFHKIARQMWKNCQKWWLFGDLWYTLVISNAYNICFILNILHLIILKCSIFDFTCLLFKLLMYLIKYLRTFVHFLLKLYYNTTYHYVFNFRNNLISNIRIFDFIYYSFTFSIFLHINKKHFRWQILTLRNIFCSS